MGEIQGVFKTLDCIDLKCLIEKKANPKRPIEQYEAITTENQLKGQDRIAKRPPTPQPRRVSRDSVIVEPTPIQEPRDDTTGRTVRKPPPRSQSMTRPTVEKGTATPREERQGTSIPAEAVVPLRRNEGYQRSLALPLTGIRGQSSRGQSLSRMSTNNVRNTRM